MGNYTPLEDFVALKQAISLIPAEIKLASALEAEHFTELSNHISQLQTAISTKVDGNLYDSQRSDLKDFFADQLAKSRKQEATLATKLSTVERDLKGAEIEIKRLHEDLSMKAPIEEIGKIWRNFQSFAEYKDFKALYNKVIPEMAKHEAHMQDHKNEIHKFGEIVQRFDEIISEKASKSELKLF
jgi:hypothetical protein